VTAELAAGEFREISRLVREHTGIELGDSKRMLCQTRLGRRLRALGLDSYRAYLDLLADSASPEHGELVNAISTNVTAFFREAHHFELVGTLVRELASRQRRIRVWSAGCSSGEEPWSLAITIRDALGACSGLDVRVLATDIDTDILARAAAGVYTDTAVAPVPRAQLKRYFARGTGPNAGRWRVADDLRSLVSFKQLNLFDRWPMQGPFDVILCRNVIIYFSADNKAKLIRRYHGLLGSGGHLLLGHSESIAHGFGGFGLVGRSAYRKAVT
jgi:chemotaxis protein methyltransferase CheR